MATYIPAPYDPMQEAMMRLGQALGGQLGDKVLNPLMGNYTQAQRQQKDAQSLYAMSLDPNSEMGQLNAQQRYAQGLQLLPGQAYQGELGTALPQMLTPQGQSAMMNYAMQKQLAQILNPMQAQQMSQSAGLYPGQLAGQQQDLRQGAQQMEKGQYDLAEAKRTQNQRDEAASTDIAYKKSATAHNIAQASVAMNPRTAGPLTVARAGDGTGFEPGTTFQVDKDGNVDIKNVPKTTTASDFQIVENEDGEYVRINKLTGATMPMAVKAKSDPEKRIKESFLKQHGDPSTWNEATWSKYNETASKIKVTNQQALSRESIEGLNSKAQMVGILQEMKMDSMKNSDLLGPIAGRYTTMKDALGAASGREADFVNLVAQRGDAIRKLAGAAFTETEKGLYFPMFPGLEDNIEAFIAKSDRLEQVMTDRLRGEVKTYNSVGYSNIEAQVLLDQYNPMKRMMGQGQSSTPSQTGAAPVSDAEARNLLKTKYGMTDAQIDAQLGVK